MMSSEIFDKIKKMGSRGALEGSGCGRWDGWGWGGSTDAVDDGETCAETVTCVAVAFAGVPFYHDCDCDCECDGDEW